MPQYWLVGAMWGGIDDALGVFIKRGYWYCWDPKANTDIPSAVKDCFPKIQVGDRLAVKKMLGRGSPSIEIRALGVVKDIDYDEWRIYVDWLVIDLNRQVPVKNYMGSIHGPLSADDDYTRLVFQL